MREPTTRPMPTPPQWSPALTAGMTSDAVASWIVVTREPQWSPALTAGMTLPRRTGTCGFVPCRNGARHLRPG
mgnify:CR=1 FL=1